jgi:hypothetical protein
MRLIGYGGGPHPAKIAMRARQHGPLPPGLLPARRRFLAWRGQRIAVLRSIVARDGREERIAADASVITAITFEAVEEEERG